MNLKFPLVTFLLFISFSGYAQNSRQDNGYLIYALGKDTSIIGHFQLLNDDFSATVVMIRDLNVHKLKGRFFPNGELQYVEGFNYKPIAGKDSQLLQTYKLYRNEDTTYVEHKRGDSITVQRYRLRAMLGGGLGPHTFMPVLLACYAPAKIGDSVVSIHLGLGNPRKFVLKRINKRTVTTSTPAMGTFTIYMDEKDKVDSINAMGTFYNVRGTVVRYLNMDSLILVNAKREQQSGPLGNLNKADSVQTIIGTTSVKISYSRPAMRGRIIFGEVVPWNRHWRTGANAATKITLSAPIYLKDKILPAGSYSIFTTPSPNGWTMMFNKEANIWGTEYNPDHDILRVPMQTTTLKEAVELLTIEVVSVGNIGAINVIWENTKASVEFTTE